MRSLLFLPLILAAVIQPVRAAPLVLQHHPYHAACTHGPIRCDADILDGVHRDVGAYSPDQLRAAYGLPATPASIQTVAIVDAYADPSVETDLAISSAHYGLPTCTKASGCLEVVDERGGQQLPQPDPGWSVEIGLDVQTVHGLCPSCRILLVEADAPTDTDLIAAEQTAARLGATEISNSWGGNEDPAEAARNQDFAYPGIAVTASTGDNGYGTSWPAVIPDVLAVGGTTLRILPDGTYAGETAWAGSGSGCSVYEQAPAWQRTANGWDGTGCGSSRGIADVAADADPNTGVMVYTSGQGWLQVGGTSLSSPILASVIALAGGEAGSQHPASVPYANASHLHDITAGFTGICSPTPQCVAGSGYDGPTGLGSPDGIAGFQVPVLPTPLPTDTPTPTATVPPIPGPGHPHGRCARWGPQRYHFSQNQDGTWRRWREQDCVLWIPRP